MVLRASLFSLALLGLGALLLSLRLLPGPEPAAPGAPPAAPQPPRGEEILALVERTPLVLPLRRPRLLVAKSRRELFLYDGERLMRTFPIGLGPNPAGAKRVQGDGRTPEGEYRVCLKNANSKYYLALGLNYPNRADAERGLAAGILDQRQYEAVAAAEARGGCPPWDTRLGGTIVIHGRGASADWTLGCVALEDLDMRVLYDAVPVGTPVRITP